MQALSTNISSASLSETSSAFTSLNEVINRANTLIADFNKKVEKRVEEYKMRKMSAIERIEFAKKNKAKENEI